ncbi:Putative Type I phosphodiesterase/nucleotide pyrophosphatase/phosphate transferase [Septoria linicola]|uniref:GPI ethanolamine phosphate transferase 2 n=1 Tax=Septoria linicola TaxID=215465 RepID=A0A9Q9EIN7_9PEZI|nr:putative Type I phosphodiesterase/nucleotide pyrophosphatase/phosphate transferase [Septoria linicola]USW51284.1 Putative Type I phosphodiesterase/nucleotide pyrophosphatase/phosphate transferase [Septoria linicola]
MARPSRARTAALVLANLLLPAAVLIFASGFFPYKPVLPGLARFEQTEQDDRAKALGENGTAVATFDKVIFMVVDALRSDFVYGHDSAMEFTQSLIRAGAAIPFTAHATPPTVTMPRVKALTTGSVPSFLDLILNFAESDTTSSLATQDTWLAQIKARGGKLVFYGDDTWLKLFPDSPNPEEPPFFMRSDGTSSFFVSDFTEVDNNVTRHVPDELANSDWDAMVMHYLGLDHIGHKTGPLGPNMLPKQREMDDIVRQIFDAMEKEEHHANTLLVLAGDHGMNAGGNHGGSGPGETEPALLFASPKFRDAARQTKLDRFMGEKDRVEYDCPTKPKAGTEFHYYTKVEQSDFVPTLAGLLGLPIPKNSLGVSIPEMEILTNERERLWHLKRNAEQMLEIVKATYGDKKWEETVSIIETLLVSSQTPEDFAKTAKMCEQAESEKKLACLWVGSKAHLKFTTKTPNDLLRQAQSRLMGFLLAAQDELSGTASSYNIPRMFVGMALTAVIIALTLFSFPQLWPVTSAGASFALISILYGIMMFASSYVEEEQHFWYWLTPAWIAVLSINSLPRFTRMDNRIRLMAAVFALLAVHRLSVRWNQTGQKHAGAPDIVHTAFPRNHVLMWMLILATYAYQGYLLVTRTFAGLLGPEIGVALAVVCVLPGIVFKLNFTQADAPELVQGLASKIREWTASADLVLQARIPFIILAATTLVVVTLALISHRDSTGTNSQVGKLPSLTERLHTMLSLFLIMQSRAPNVILFLGWEIQREALSYIVHSRTPNGSKSGARKPITAIATTIALFSHVTFFCTGGSNSISSIDLSNAYNGVADYNIVAVGVLLFASNWTGAIWWCSAATLLLSGDAINSKRSIFAPSAPSYTSGNGSKSWIDAERKRLHEESLRATMGPEKTKTAGNKNTNAAEGAAQWQVYVCHMTAFIATGLLAVMASCTALRTHLFIWTVFSPKYLYAMAWSVGWHLLVNVGLGSLLNGLRGVA